jgi:hypothetical protein
LLGQEIDEDCKKVFAVRFHIGLLLHVQNLADSGNNFGRSSLTSENFVHISVVHKQSGLFGNGHLKPLLIFAISQKFRLYTQAKVRKFAQIHK